MEPIVYRHWGDAPEPEPEVARLRRDLHATRQALLEEQARTERLEPVAYAAHEYCRKLLDDSVDVADYDSATDKLVAVHQATSPAPGPATHVVVAVDELERLRRIARVARLWANGEYDDFDLFQEIKAAGSVR